MPNISRHALASGFSWLEPGVNARRLTQKLNRDGALARRGFISRPVLSELFEDGQSVPDCKLPRQPDTVAVHFDGMATRTGEFKTMGANLLRVDGEVEHPQTFTFDQLANIPTEFQIADVSTIDPSRAGDAVWLRGLLQVVQPNPSATFLGLHGSHDDFHASIPLAEVRERGFVIYRLDGQPLPREKGGPVRFFIRDHASCNTDDIDECANVKFVDHIELTATKGFDNRPQDDDEHAKLHQ